MTSRGSGVLSNRPLQISEPIKSVSSIKKLRLHGHLSKDLSAYWRQICAARFHHDMLLTVFASHVNIFNCPTGHPLCRSLLYDAHTVQLHRLSNSHRLGVCDRAYVLQSLTEDPAVIPGYHNTNITAKLTSVVEGSMKTAANISL